jgi:hypothetical protein
MVALTRVNGSTPLPASVEAGSVDSTPAVSRDGGGGQWPVDDTLDVVGLVSDMIDGPAGGEGGDVRVERRRG